jgi:predicted TIM-barrel fold metal-dependent hydrolase
MTWRRDLGLPPGDRAIRHGRRHLLQHVQLTTCGYTTDPPLLCALVVFGADRMLFSVDYPFSDNSRAAAFLRDARLGPADKQKIVHGNAERLLRL